MIDVDGQKCVKDKHCHQEISIVPKQQKNMEKCPPPPTKEWEGAQLRRTPTGGRTPIRTQFQSGPHPNWVRPRLGFQWPPIAPLCGQILFWPLQWDSDPFLDLKFTIKDPL